MSLGQRLLIAVLGTRFRDHLLGSLKFWTVTGCVGSAAALLGLVAAGQIGPPWPLELSVFILGVANGTFAVAAIGSMMALAGAGPRGREGVRMGLWGAAQAIAFAIGGFLGTAMFDLLQALFGDPARAYMCVFAVEACIFLAAARLAAQIAQPGVRIDTQLKSNKKWRLSA